MPTSPDRRLLARLFALCVMLSLLTGCATPVAGLALPADQPAPAPTETQPPAVTPQPTATKRPTATTATVSPRLWISPLLPQHFREQLILPSTVQVTSDATIANLWIDYRPPKGQQAVEIDHTAWIYVVAGPFPTIADQTGWGDITETWQGTFRDIPDEPYSFGKQPLLMTQETRTAMESILGPGSAQGIQIVGEDTLLETAWQQTGWAIIPFEDIQPRWKVLSVRLVRS